MSRIGDAIRIVLTLILVGFVFTETGWATAFCILLIAARSEILDYNEG